MNHVDKPPYLGFGLGLRPQHYEEILNGAPAVDWFEVISENYMIPGGQPLRILDQICERYPVVMHGVSLSIASTAPLDSTIWRAEDACRSASSPKWISDHLCWTGVHGVNLHDLLPIPYTEEALDHVVDRVSQVQDFLGRRLTLENVSSYVTFGQSEMTEWEFVSEVAKRADCWLLFDVNNVYVSAFNHGFSTDDFLHGVPARPRRPVPCGRTQPRGEPHHRHPRPSGLRRGLGFLSRGGAPFRPGVDHDRARRQHSAARRAGRGARPCAREIAREALRGQNGLRPRNERASKTFRKASRRGILAGDDAILGEINDSAREQRTVLFGVYRNAYVARLAEILGDDYEQVHAYLGDAGFAKLVKAYIAANPSDQRSARWFGRHLPAFAHTAVPFADHREVGEIASLEKALDDAFDGPDAEPLSLSDLATIPPEDWPRLTFEPHPTAIRLTFDTNAAAIWSALKAETAPPSSPAASPNRKPFSSGVRTSWRGSGRSAPKKP